MSLTKTLITRKELAMLIGTVTVDQVRRNEKRWGLDKARRDLNCRCVRYQTRIAFTILKGKGWME